MENSGKTKEQLIAELGELRRRIVELEKSEAERKQTEEALQESEEKYRTLTENVNLGIYRVTPGPEGKFIEVNPALVKMFGYKSRKELLSINAADLYQNPKNRGKFSEKLIRQGFVTGEELQLKKKDGTPLIISVSAVAVKDEKGKVQYYDGINEDITERKRAEQALRESEEKLQRMFEFATDGIVVTDLNGNIMELNEAAVRLRGSDSKEKLIGRSTFELIAEKDRVRVMEILKSALEDGQIRRDVELTFLTEDGREYFAEVSSALLRDAAGNSVGFIAVFRDITERKQAEEALKLAHAELDQIFDATADAIRVVGKDFNILRANEVFEALSGISKDEAVGKKCYDILHSPRCHTPNCPLTRILNGEERIEIEEERERGDGTRLSCIVTVTPFRQPDGKVIGIVATIKDITERKRAEEALQESEKRFKDITENALEWVWETDVNGKYIYASLVCEKILGYKPEELLEKHFYDLFLPEEREQLKKAAFETFVKKQPFREFINPNVHKNGEIVWLSTSGVPILDERGNLLGYRGADIDITERKRAEEALQESWQKYRMLFELSPIGITTLDMKGIITACNPAVFKEGGYTEDEIVGKHFSKVAPVRLRDIPKFIRTFSSILRGKVPKPFEVAYHRKDGTTGWTEIHVALLEVDGKKTGVQVLQRDITERKQVEEKIREAKESYDRITDNADEAIFRVEAEGGHIIYVNPAAERLLGYTQAEWLADSTLGFKLIHPDYTEKQQQIIREINTTKKPIKNAVLGWITKDGREIIVEYTIIPVMDKKGEIIYFESIGRDITERKRAEQALRESEERYRSLVSNVKLGVFRSTPEPAGRFLEVNPAMEKITGYRRKELLQMNVSDLYVHPEERERVLEEVASGVGKVTREVQFKKKDGTEIVVSDTKVVVRDDAGEVLYFDGILDDITERKEAEEKLKKSEERFRIASQIASDVVYERDLQTGIATFYGDIDTHLGYDSGEYPRTWEGWKEHVHPEDLAWIESKPIEQLEPDVPYSIEYRMRKKDGTYMTWFDQIMVILDEKTGEPIKFIGAATDITERKQAEERLLESEERFRRFFENEPEYCYMISPESIIIDVNRAALEALGYKKEELIGESLQTIYAPESLPKMKQLFERWKTTEALRNEELTIISKDGNRRTVLLSADVVKNKEGKVLHSVSVQRDITERKQAEQQLKESESFLNNIIEQSPFSTWISDDKGTNIRQNQACRELFGIERDEEVIGKYNIFKDEEIRRQGLMPLFEEVFSKGKTLNLVIDYDFRKVKHVKVPGATHKILEATHFPIKDANGKVTHVVVQHQDITERKQAEEALKQSSKQLRNLSAHLESVREEERTAIAREIHDELGQSLTALKMDLSWLSKRLPKEQESLVQKTTLMSGLINSTIQTVKRISTDLRPGLLDDIGIVAAIEWQAGEFQDRTGIKCRLSIDPEDFVIDRDTTTTIFRIFQEALTNAYRHANATRLSVSLKRKANKLALKVRDNGKGITEEQISDPKSFGLMGMRERASYHGGEVKIRGISGKGTVLTFSIPVGKGELDDKNTRC